MTPAPDATLLASCTAEPCLFERLPTSSFPVAAVDFHVVAGCAADAIAKHLVAELGPRPTDALGQLMRPQYTGPLSAERPTLDFLANVICC